MTVLNDQVEGQFHTMMAFKVLTSAIESLFIGLPLLIKNHPCQCLLPLKGYSLLERYFNSWFFYVLARLYNSGRPLTRAEGEVPSWWDCSNGEQIARLEKQTLPILFFIVLGSLMSERLL